jgi:hypothetical protein
MFYACFFKSILKYTRFHVEFFITRSSGVSFLKVQKWLTNPAAQHKSVNWLSYHSKKCKQKAQMQYW